IRTASRLFSAHQVAEGQSFTTIMVSRSRMRAIRTASRLFSAQEPLRERDCKNICADPGIEPEHVRSQANCLTVAPSWQRHKYNTLFTRKYTLENTNLVKRPE